MKNKTIKNIAITSFAIGILGLTIGKIIKTKKEKQTYTKMIDSTMNNGLNQSGSAIRNDKDDNNYYDWKEIDKDYIELDYKKAK